MADSTSRYSLRYAAAYTAFVFAIGVFLVWFVLAFESTPGALVWLGIGMFALLCLLGLGLGAMLHYSTRKPLLGLENALSKFLDGQYDAASFPASGCLSGIHSQLQELTDRYKHQLGFRESILQGLPMPCLIVDPEQRITFLNRECLDMLGQNVAPETFYGRMMSQLFYKDDRKAVIGTCMEEDSRITNREAVFKHADGSDINVLANLFPLHDVERKVTGGCCIYLNTTDLKKKEAEILRQNERIAKAGAEAGEVATELSVAAEQLSKLVSTARQGARDQTDRTTETASAMEEMYATVLEVARHAQEAAENAEGAKTQAEEGAHIVSGVMNAIDQVAQHAADLKASMEDLDVRSEAIGKVLSVIEDIADQTNLLALNAAIEAARAGDAGRGFAVVADEVRKLAEKTMQATTEVHTAIVGIQEGARANVKATETAVSSVQRSTEMASRSGEALAQIVAVSETTADRVRAIASAAEEQSAASDEINRATMEVSRISNETDKIMVESAQAVQRLSELADALSDTIREMQ